MKHLKFAALLLFFASSIAMFSCKGKSSTTNTDTTEIAPPVDTTTMQPAPVVISPDDSLNSMVKDAIKDYPGVNAAVSNGEVTLTGDITRDKLPKLMMAVNAIHPKKVNNNLTIKK